MKNILKKSNQKGSLMVEALALLGLITMVTPVLYKKAAERTTELQDINVATQMRMISSAVDDFLKDNYKEIGETPDYVGDVFSLTDKDRERLEGYLPKGFDLTQSRLFDEFQIRVRRQEVEDKKGQIHNIYTSAVLAPTTEDLTRMRSSKIASMIGSSGGVYRDGMLQGVQGSWEANPVADYGFTIDNSIRNESLVVISTKAISSAKGDVSSDDVLFRIDTGDIAENTMQVALRMNGNDIRGLTNLIAKDSGSDVEHAGELVIGRLEGGFVKEMTNLFVTGKVNIKQSLTVDGETKLKNGLTVDGKATFNNGLEVTNGDTTLKNTTIDGTLNVTGDTTLKKTTIDGDLIQSGGKVDFDATEITMKSKGDINIDAAKNLYMNGGDSVHIQQGGTDRIVIDKTGNTITGDTTFKDGDVTVENNLNVGGDIKVEGDIILVRPEGEESNVLADWLNAKKGIRVGGVSADGKSSLGEYFSVDSKGATAAVGTGSNKKTKISTKEASSFIGYNYGNGSNYQGFKSTEDEQRIQHTSSTYLTLTRDDKSFDMIYMQANSGTKAKLGDEGIDLTADYTNLHLGFNSWDLKIDSSSGINSYNNISGDDSKFAVEMGDNTMLVDDRGMALFNGREAAKDKKSVKEVTTGLEGSILADSGAKIGISRQGIIEVASPADVNDKGGYFKGRRLVSDKNTYPQKNIFHGYGADGGSFSTRYDYYQVNPAYTSVMNDIKLATRGGARLSDILPDYINKGIYVVDNTYKESKIDDWEGQGIAPSGKECLTSSGELDNTCMASPWMGFVPAPQCPRGYAKVITLNPIRWRMSEVYTVFNPSDGWGDTESVYKTNIGKDFKKYFIQPTDPKLAEFALTEGGGDSHSHIATGTRPLTFQTNTWLNTTISPLFGDADCRNTSKPCLTTGDSANFVGWHAIMGFIYRPTHYNTLLTDMGVTVNNNNVYWNIFPVYAGDMAAYANVYCYFERNTADTGTKWQWGDETDSPVYKYDQINNYHHGFVKDAAWSAAVNDPQLGYDDAW